MSAYRPSPLFSEIRRLLENGDIEGMSPDAVMRLTLAAIEEISHGMWEVNKRVGELSARIEADIKEHTLLINRMEQLESRIRAVEDATPGAIYTRWLENHYGTTVALTIVTVFFVLATIMNAMIQFGDNITQVLDWLGFVG